MYNDNTLPDITQLRDEDYCYNLKSEVTELQFIGYCPECDKRIVAGDELYIYQCGICCSEICGTKFEEDEKNA